MCLLFSFVRVFQRPSLRAARLLFVLLLLSGGLQTLSRAQTPIWGADPNFAARANNLVKSFVLQSDGKVWAGGLFTEANGVPMRSLARFNSDGTLDATVPDPGINSVTYGVESMAQQSDGKLIVAGGFDFVQGVPRRNIARLNNDGSLDTSFNPGTGPNDFIYGMVLQNDGKILIAGDFTTFNGTPRVRLARLNSDGSLDTSFDPGGGATVALVNPQMSDAANILNIALQSDGKLLVVGDFAAINGVTRQRIARINTDGTLDTSFDPGTGANDQVRAVAVQKDGKVLIGGKFTSINGVASPYIARLNPDGSLDSTFNTGTGPNDSVFVIALQSDGNKILIGGQFSLVNNLPRTAAARLNADGSVDAAFAYDPAADPLPGVLGPVLTLLAQPDHKVLVGGSFSKVNSVIASNITRLMPNVLRAQTIDFPAQAQATQSFSSAVTGTFALGPLATASSGLPVSYTSLTPGVCSVSGTTVTALQQGDCTIAANQPGNAEYSPAGQVTQTVRIVITTTVAGNVVAVPTLDVWGLLMLMGLLGFFARVADRRGLLVRAVTRL